MRLKIAFKPPMIYEVGEVLRNRLLLLLLLHPLTNFEKDLRHYVSNTTHTLEKSRLDVS